MPSEPDHGAEYAVFRPVRTGNAFEETVERLLQAIKLGVVQHGERLPAERDLSGRLAVSRMTLREAIRDLQQAGYVESRRGRSGGTFVTYRPQAPRRTRVRRVDAELRAELPDALALRGVLEPGAAALSAGRSLDARERRYLERQLQECAEASPRHYRQLDSRLHLAITELAGSPSLSAAVADVRMRLNDLLDVIPLLPTNIAHSNSQHARIVASVLGGEPAIARSAMEEHLAGTAALLRGFLA